MKLDPRVTYAIKKEGETEIFELAIQACFIDGRFCYFNFERGHLLDGEIVEDSENRIVFDRGDNYPSCKLVIAPLTYQDFCNQIRPNVDPYVRQYIHDLDDVYVWYRKLVDMT